MGTLMPASRRKSERSYGNGACVETASWRSASACDGGTCVIAGHGPAVVGVRDSQLGEASLVLEFSPAAWRLFTAGLK